jgi:hypothetical protein
LVSGTTIKTINNLLGAGDVSVRHIFNLLLTIISLGYTFSLNDIGRIVITYIQLQRTGFTTKFVCVPNRTILRYIHANGEQTHQYLIIAESLAGNGWELHMNNLKQKNLKYLRILGCDELIWV